MSTVTSVINDPATSSSLDPYRQLSFPILLPSADAIGIYNLLYRQLFDRHRDLRLPVSFLAYHLAAAFDIAGRPRDGGVQPNCRMTAMSGDRARSMWEKPMNASLVLAALTLSAGAPFRVPSERQ